MAVTEQKKKMAKTEYYTPAKDHGPVCSGITVRAENLNCVYKAGQKVKVFYRFVTSQYGWVPSLEPNFTFISPHIGFTDGWIGTFFIFISILNFTSFLFRGERITILFFKILQIILLIFSCINFNVFETNNRWNCRHRFQPEQLCPRYG